MKAFGLRLVQWNVLGDDTSLASSDKEITPPAGLNVTIDGPVTNPWHVYNIVGRYQAILSQGFQTGLNWMKPVPFKGFISLAHELSPSMVLAIEQVIPLIQKANFTFVNVATCDKTVNAPIQNGDLYLPDSAPFTKFIRSIKLPLDASAVDGGNGASTFGKNVEDPNSTSGATRIVFFRNILMLTLSLLFTIEQ
jgi:hypothetical protein